MVQAAVIIACNDEHEGGTLNGNSRCLETSLASSLNIFLCSASETVLLSLLTLTCMCVVVVARRRRIPGMLFNLILRNILGHKDLTAIMGVTFCCIVQSAFIDNNLLRKATL